MTNTTTKTVTIVIASTKEFFYSLIVDSNIYHSSDA